MTVVDPALDAPVEALRPYCPEPALRPLWRAGLLTVGDVERAGDLTVLRGVAAGRAAQVAAAIDAWTLAGCPPPPPTTARTAREVGEERAQARRVEQAAARFGLTRADVLSTTQVLETVRPGVVHRSSVYRLPGFPAPLFGAGPRARFWRRTDVEAWASSELNTQPGRGRARDDRDAAYRARRRAAQARLAPVGRPQKSQYRGVRWRAATGQWRAVVCLPADGEGPAREMSGGLYPVEEDAARAVDFYRWQVGFPPANFPDDLEGTLARAGEWSSRRRRGVGDMIVAVLHRDRSLSVDDVHELIPEACTTRAAVAATLAKFVRDGRVRRASPGRFSLPPVATPVRRP